MRQLPAHCAREGAAVLHWLGGASKAHTCCGRAHWLSRPRLSSSVAFRGQPITDIGRRGKFLIFRLEARYPADPPAHERRPAGRAAVRPHRDPPPPDPGPGGRPAPGFQRSAQVWPGLAGSRPANASWPTWALSRSIPPSPPRHCIHRLQHTRRQLKPLLLDQSFIAGLGNIYTDEALHLAGLHPLQAAHSLNAMPRLPACGRASGRCCWMASSARGQASIGSTAAAISRIIFAFTSARDSPARSAGHPWSAW